MLGKWTQDIWGRKAGSQKIKKRMGALDNFTFRINVYWQVGYLCRDLLPWFGGDHLDP